MNRLKMSSSSNNDRKMSKQLIMKPTNHIKEKYESRPSSGRKHDTNNDQIDRLYQDILDNIVDERYLREICGLSDLASTTTLQLHIDSSHQSIFEIHNFLPQLEYLVLDNSKIGSIRDLGVGLRNIRHLSLFQCGLHDLDGIGVLTGLEELNIEENYIIDLHPLAMHETLKRLNASGNNLTDLSFADTLSTCPSLRLLSLQRNPIASVPNYRLIVSSLIPLVERLDGIPVDPSSSAKVTPTMVLEAANIAANITNAYDLSSSYASASANEMESSTSLPDTGSELTHGSNMVLAGSAAMAIRRRHDSRSDSESTISTPLDVFDKVLSGNSHTPTSSIMSSYFKEGDITDMIAGVDTVMYDSPDRRQHRRPSSTGTWTNPAHKPPPTSLKMQNNEVESVMTSSSSRRPASAAFIQSHMSSSSSIMSSNIEDSDDVIRSRLSSRSGFRSGPSSLSMQHLTSYNRSKSIVHMDVVRRTHHDANDHDIEILAMEDEDSSEEGTGSSSNHPMIPNFKHDSHDDDTDEEENIVSHAARHRMMSSQGRRGTTAIPSTTSSSSHNTTSKSSYTNTSSSAAYSHHMHADFFEVPSSRPPSARGGARPNSRGSSIHDMHSSSQRESNAMIAGKSLGFDLYGSLAAIEQWADSNDVSDDEIHEVDMAIKALASTSSSLSSSKSISSVAQSIASAADVVVASNFPIAVRDGLGRGAPAKRAIHVAGGGGAALSPIHHDKKATIDSSMILNRDKILNMFVKDDSEIGSEVDTITSTPTSKNASSSSEPENHSPQVKASRKRSETVAGNPSIFPMNMTNKPTDTQPIITSKPTTVTSSIVATNDHDIGAGVMMSDHDLISMLQKPPKTIIQLRTKSSFQAFFKGIDQDRMRKLLEVAYCDISNDMQRHEKVNKRMELLREL